MSGLGGRVQADLTRYWILNGVPIAEQLTITYAPNDWRAHSIPEEIHNLYAPQLRQMAGLYNGLVDGNGDTVNPEPEAVVNRWLVEARSTTHSDVDVGSDALLEPVTDPNDPLMYDYFGRLPRKGARRVSKSIYDAAVAGMRGKYEAEFVKWAEAMIVEHEQRRAQLGDTMADYILGPRPNLNDMVQARMRDYDARPELH